MTSDYKLYYFVSRGLCETIRFLLKYGGIEFEDVRFTVEEWPQWKPKFQFGVVPVLEHKGKRADQSVAIARYVAKRVKLTGSDDWEDLEIDAVVDTFKDLVTKLQTIIYENDETRKKSLEETLIKETLPYYLTRFEDLVQTNNGYLALGRLTWADLYFASTSPIFDFFLEQDVLADYPALQGVRDRVNSLPAIKKWIEERPEIAYVKP